MVNWLVELVFRLVSFKSSKVIKRPEEFVTAQLGQTSL